MIGEGLIKQVDDDDGNTKAGRVDKKEEEETKGRASADSYVVGKLQQVDGRSSEVFSRWRNMKSLQETKECFVETSKQTGAGDGKTSPAVKGQVGK